MNPPVRSAILLAAGRGSRLRPYTDHTPKPLLPWKQKPALHWILDSLRDAGIEQAVLVTHYLQEQINNFCHDYSSDHPGMQVTTVRQSELDGTATAVTAALQQHPDWFDQTYLVTATDYLPDPAFYPDFLAFHREHDQPLSISLRKIPEQESSARSSVAYTDEFVINQVVEKPPPGTAPSPYSANLVYVLPAAINSHLRAVERSARGEFELQSAVNALLDTGYRGRGLVQSAPLEWTPDLLDE